MSICKCSKDRHSATVILWAAAGVERWVTAVDAVALAISRIDGVCSSPSQVDSRLILGTERAAQWICALT